ncbi:hypothetical protein LW135_05815 [Helicobacter sp. faydin-H20]|uniref:hypothetical protein n=1 Tax=Helicobacter anatolicus TaxID=2905874 RepID=UPI001E3AB040|nr:hypothetical protein [Helicobacter anatolicus]MCE3037348.1 hypothetical protein [Helicobacter anatolicus]
MLYIGGGGLIGIEHLDFVSYVDAGLQYFFQDTWGMNFGLRYYFPLWIKAENSKSLTFNLGVSFIY